MDFTGNEKHDITLDDAAKLTANYRSSAGAKALLGSYFSIAGINKILDQDGCIGIRIYYGLTDSGEKCFVLSGVTSNGDDLYDGQLAEYGIGCPPRCSRSNPLNS
jgi:hypothetical protein